MKMTEFRPELGFFVPIRPKNGESFFLIFVIALMRQMRIFWKMSLKSDRRGPTAATQLFSALLNNRKPDPL